MGRIEDSAILSNVELHIGISKVILRELLVEPRSLYSLSVAVANAFPQAVAAVPNVLPLVLTSNVLAALGHENLVDFDTYPRDLTWVRGDKSYETRWSLTFDGWVLAMESANGSAAKT